MLKSFVFCLCMVFAPLIAANDDNLRPLRYCEPNQAPIAFKQYKDVPNQPENKPINLTENFLYFSYEGKADEKHQYKFVVTVRVENFNEFFYKKFLLDRYAYWLDWASETHPDYKGDIISYYSHPYEGKMLYYIVWFTDFLKDNQIFIKRYWEEK